MTDWLRLIGSLSLAGSLLALAILLIRLVARRFLSRRLFYLLWLLVIFQLLVPIPYGQIAIQNLPLQPMQIIKTSQAVDSSSNTAAANENPASLPGSTSGNHGNSAALESSAGSPNQIPANDTVTGITIKDALVRVTHVLAQIRTDMTNVVRPFALPLLLAWLFGVLFIFGLELHRYRRLMHLIRSNASCASESEHQVLISCCQAVGIRRSVNLMHNASIPSPILTGIFHPTIYLPDRNLSRTDLRLILDHELTHLQSGDLIIKLFMQIACAIHWFNPFLKVIQRQFLLDCELACDESVAQRLSWPDRRQYGELLLQQAEKTTYLHLGGAEALSVNGHQLRQRLQAVLHGYKSSRKKRIISLIAIVILFLASFSIGVYTWPNRSSTQRYTVDAFNVYQIDWQKLFDQIGLSTQARVDRLRIEFSADGQIGIFALDVFDQKSLDDRNHSKRVEINYDPSNRQLRVESNASAPIRTPDNASDLRLADKSALSRVVKILERPDWAEQTKALGFPYWGMAFEGDATLGTPIDHTFLIRADGSLDKPKQPDMPLPYGTTLNLFGMTAKVGSSESVYYYLLSDTSAVSGAASGSAGNPPASAPDTTVATNPDSLVNATLQDNGKLLAHYPEAVLPLYRSKEIVSCGYNHDEAVSSFLGQDYHLVSYRSSASPVEVYDYYRALLTRVDDRYGDSRLDLSGWIGDWPVNINLFIENEGIVEVSLVIGYDRPRADAKDMYVEPTASSRIDPPSQSALLGKYYEEHFENENYRMLVVRYSTPMSKDEAMSYYRNKYQSADHFLEQHQGDGFEFIGWQDLTYDYKIFFRNAKGQLEISWTITSPQ